jgi:hypothetical protein
MLVTYIQTDTEILPATPSLIPFTIICRPGKHDSVSQRLKNIPTNTVPQWVWGPVKNFFWPPSKGRPAKIFYTKSESITPGCRVSLALSERVHLYNGLKMILSTKTKTFAMQLGPRPPTGVVIHISFPTLLSALLIHT